MLEQTAFFCAAAAVKQRAELEWFLTKTKVPYVFLTTPLSEWLDPCTSNWIFLWWWFIKLVPEFSRPAGGWCGDDAEVHLEMWPFPAAALEFRAGLASPAAQVIYWMLQANSCLPCLSQGGSWHTALPQLLVFREKPGTAALDAEGSVEQLPRMAPASSRACAT